MNEEFNIHVARRLEDIRLSTLLEESAVQRGTDLNALLRAAAARGGALSGGLLNQEVDVIFAATEAMVDTVIAYRKELAARAPELLLEYPYLKEFHVKLNQLADSAVIAVQQRHATKSQFPAATLNAILGVATRRVKVLKNKINKEIQAMALEGKLGMHGRNQSHQVTNVFHGPVGNVAQTSQHFNQTAKAQVSSAGLPEQGRERPVKATRTPWLSGSFYLFAVVSLIFVALVAARLVTVVVLPIVLIFGIIVVSVVGAMQLRHDETLSEKGFLSLMLASLKTLPLLKRSKG